MFAVLAGAGVPEDEAKKHYVEVRDNQFSLKLFIRTLFSRFDIKTNQAEIYETIMRESAKFRNEEMIRAIQRIGKENCYIVTNGEREFNTDKLKYSGVWDLVGEDRIRIVPGEKNHAIKEICAQNQESEVVFIDDKLKFIDEPGLRNIANLTTIHYKSEDFERIMKRIDSPLSELKKRK